MKLQLKKRIRVGGFTVAEIMVTSGVLVVVGLCAIAVLRSGMLLSAKNTAENLAHDSARIAVNRLLHDIHEAVSIPQLGHIVSGDLTANPSAPKGSWTPSGTNVTFWAETTPVATGSAGVSFQMMGSPGDPNGGPFDIKNDPGNPELIQIESGTNHAPQIGMRLIFPYYNMEDDIVKVTSNGVNHYNVWTANALETRFKTKKNGPIYICYYTTRWAYVVENGELHLYSSSPPPAGVTWPVVVARNIINSDPSKHAQPATPFTQATSQYVGVNLSTEDSHYTNRNFKSVNTLLAGSVPYRAKLCVYQ